MIDVQVLRGKRTGRVRVVMECDGSVVRVEFADDAQAIAAGRLLMREATVAEGTGRHVWLPLPFGQGQFEIDSPSVARKLALVLIALGKG